MSWPPLIPAAAALLCLEVSVAFALIYAKVTRRKADLIFSGVALGLAWMRWASFMRRSAADVESALCWVRLEYAACFMVLALFAHFVSTTIEKPLGRNALVPVYALAAALVGLTWTDWLVRLPGFPVAPADLEPYARTPALTVIIAVLLAAGLVGLVQVLRRRPPESMALSPLAQHRHHTFAAGMVVILSPAVAEWASFSLPGLRGVSIQSVGAVLFCLIIARALGKEVVRAESEKRRLADLAEFRSRAVRDVAHELKNPLTAIQMATQTVLEGTQHGLDPTAQCEMLEMCLDACRRLNRLINNMLDTARMEAGRDLEVHAEPTDVPALVESVVAFQSRTTVTHRLALHSELGARMARLDADKMHQVLTNLIHNAIKYSPDGGDITVRLWQEDGRIGISVADQGIGMTPEQQARLFEPFARVVDPERKITGTGIGLHLVKRLIEAQGGTIAVASEYGVGSTFTVVLPTAPSAAPTMPAVGDDSAVEEASVHGKNPSAHCG